MVKFTKGEWIKSHHANGVIFVTHRDMRRNSGRFICTLQGGRDDVANAHLIAAAPEMYERLQWLESLPTLDWEERKKMRDLLAKARGES